MFNELQLEVAELRAELLTHELFPSEEARASFVAQGISELNAAQLLWPDNQKLKALKRLFLTEVSEQQKDR